MGIFWLEGRVAILMPGMMVPREEKLHGDKQRESLISTLAHQHSSAAADMTGSS